MPKYDVAPMPKQKEKNLCGIICKKKLSFPGDEIFLQGTTNCKRKR
jgi:hypothetical protein